MNNTFFLIKIVSRPQRHFSQTWWRIIMAILSPWRQQPGTRWFPSCWLTGRWLFLLLTPMLTLYAFMSYYFGNFYIRCTHILYKNKLPTCLCILTYVYLHTSVVTCTDTCNVLLECRHLIFLSLFNEDCLHHNRLEVAQRGSATQSLEIKSIINC